MIRSLPSSKKYRFGFRLFIILYFVFLFAPLVVTMILAFNDSMYPALPWQGFTLDWFFGNGPDTYGIFHDQTNLRSLATSFKVAVSVMVVSTFLGTCAAFLFEQECIHDPCLCMIAAHVLTRQIDVVPGHLHIGMTQHSLNGKGICPAPEQQQGGCMPE